MRRRRVTIAGWMGVIVLVAAVMAGLRRPSWLAANLAFTAALSVQFVAMVAVLTARGPSRAFWKGFAACGWGYLALSVGPFLGPATSPHLATTTLLDLAFEHCYHDPYGGPVVRANPFVPTKKDTWDRWNWPEAVVDPRMHNSSYYVMAPDTFLRIGHSFLSLPIALAGGWLGHRFATRRVVTEGER
jgi:hypothetical protein